MNTNKKLKKIGLICLIVGLVLLIAGVILLMFATTGFSFWIIIVSIILNITGINLMLMKNNDNA